MPRPPPLAPPEPVAENGRGRLIFHECLGRGGYGEVYRCTWIRDGAVEQVVVAKVLNASVARGSDAQRRLKDEARLLAALTHPGIVRVYDLVEVRGNVAMIAEYVDGHDLDRCVLDGLTPRGLVEVVGQVASALWAAWSDTSPATGRPIRLVHRDCKPENIRVTPKGDVKILDFGVARAAEMKREAQTATNTVMGSYRYMSPERFDADLQPHPSVDVFALGCILYEGLAYRRLFEHLSMREMLVLSIPGSERYEDYVRDRIAELPASTEPALVSLIERLVVRDPERRPMPNQLALACEVLARRLPGPDLKTWCRSHAWVAVGPGAGEWSGMQFHLGPSASGAFHVPQPLDSDYPDVNEFHTDGPATSDATLPDMMRVDPATVPIEPAFAPRDLVDGPALAPLPDDDGPTDQKRRVDLVDPDGTATVTVDMEAIRQSVAQQRRPALPLATGPLDDEATRQLAPSEFETMKQKVPEEVLEVVRNAPRRGLAGRAPSPATPAPAPTVSPPTPSDPPLRAPAGPEPHREAHEARRAAYEAQQAAGAERPVRARGSWGGVIANLGLLAVIVLIGVLTLLGWLILA